MSTILSDVMLFIDGADRSTASTFERRHPITEAIVTRASAADAKSAVAAVDAAARAFPSWARTTPTARRALILKAADELAKRTGDIVTAMMAETGATEGWARANVGLTIGIMQEAAACTTRCAGEILSTDRPGGLSLAIREPLGVCLAIAPWNAPVILGMRSVIWPLAYGNTTVLKASEVSPHTHRLLIDVLSAAGFPPGTINFVAHAREDAEVVSAAMIAHPAVRHVNFTGSSHVGRLVAIEAARHLKPVLLELGGKAPFLVLYDADLEAAARAAAFGAFMHQGQICMSTERVIVDRRVADPFAALLAAKAQTLVAGDPSTSNAPLGALAGAQAAARVANLVDEAVTQGAVRLTGGRRDGALMDATVLDRVTPTMKIYHEETFGPVACIVRADDDDDAVRIANDTEYGLSAAVFSRNIPRAMAIGRRIETGMCHINGPTLQDEPAAPLGGIKASGYGRFGGDAGQFAFTNLRWLTIEEAEPHYPL